MRPSQLSAPCRGKLRPHGAALAAISATCGGFREFGRRAATAARRPAVLGRFVRSTAGIGSRQRRAAAAGGGHCLRSPWTEAAADAGLRKGKLYAGGGLMIPWGGRNDRADLLMPCRQKEGRRPAIGLHAGNVEARLRMSQFRRAMRAANGVVSLLRYDSARGNRVYERDHISVAFVVKKHFADSSEEGLAYKHYGGDDTIDTLHTSILEEIYQCRRDDVKDNSSDFMDKLVRLPHWMLKIVVNILFFLDHRGKVPFDLIKADPNYASIFLTNLGSIGLQSGYHHLNNWGTNSFFCVIGKKHLAPEWHEDGSYTVRPVIGLGLTVDERIGDGYYYSGTVRLLKKLMENPELLEQPFSTPVEY